MKTVKKYSDTLHGYVAEAASKIMAWQLIRNRCHEDGKKIPLLSDIQEIKAHETERH